jgi:hypothetical protein
MWIGILMGFVRVYQVKTGYLLIIRAIYVDGIEFGEYVDLPVRTV